MHPWEWSEFWEDLTRIGVAALLGGVLGFEREWKGHWAGLRTHMLVSMGCAIFVISAMAVSGEQHEAVTRVIQGIASGIGFLGAGTILKLDDRQEIKGLTTASSIWLAAALGTTAGLAQYAISVSAALISVFVLGAIGPAEKYFEKHHAKHRREREKADKLKAERKQDNEEA